MSQASQKFPLRFIFPAFCESHQHESPPVGTLTRELKRRLLARDPYEQQYAEDFLERECGLCYSYSTAFGFSFGGEQCQLEGNASFGEFALNWPSVQLSSHSIRLGYQTPKEFAAAQAASFYTGEREAMDSKTPSLVILRPLTS